MPRVRVGTCGWNYNHWKGRFYPKDLPSSLWLAFYAQHFPTVELNFSFYREPSERSWESWRKTVPEGFCFAVKAHRFLTHVRRLKDPEAPLERVIKNARRLGPALGPILYQLPPQFHRTAENIDRLEHLLSILPPDLQHAFEFRHKSWFVEETLEQLRRQRAGFCSFHRVGMECPLAATAPFAYVRLHGSEHGGNYQDDELRDWAERIRLLSAEVDDVYVYFNNDGNAYAVYNALALTALLEASVPGAPADPAEIRR